MVHTGKSQPKCCSLGPPSPLWCVYSTPSAITGRAIVFLAILHDTVRFHHTIPYRPAVCGRSPWSNRTHIRHSKFDFNYQQAILNLLQSPRAWYAWDIEIPVSKLASLCHETTGLVSWTAPPIDQRGQDTRCYSSVPFPHTLNKADSLFLAGLSCPCSPAHRAVYASGRDRCHERKHQSAPSWLHQIRSSTSHRREGSFEAEGLLIFPLWTQLCHYPTRV